MEQQPILIVGAGPTGLTLAIELARRNIPLRIIDKLPQATDQSRALGIHARTLEIFADMGVSDAVIAQGYKVQSLVMHAQNKRIFHIEYSRVASPYPFVVILPQAHTEAILEQRLNELGGRVERGLALIRFTEERHVIQATLQHTDGKQETVTIPYLVGCDGAHSTVRHQLNLSFAGHEVKEEWILADVEIKERDINSFGIFIKNQGVFLQIPLGQNQYRLGATQRAKHVSPENEPTLEEFQLLANDYLAASITIERALWLSKFRIHYRRVDSYHKSCVLLAGDAGHIHSPAGGQGMNTGIQDAYNLAWKLALVCQGRATQALLTSYSQERIPVAKSVLRDTGMFTRLVTLHNSLAQALRNSLLPVIARFNFVQDALVNTLSQIGINYRQSAIVGEDWSGASTALKPGDRVPNIEFAQSVKHIALLFLFNQQDDIAAAIKQDYADLIEVITITDDPKLQKIYGATTNCFYLIRPDGYIAYRNNPLNPERLFAFLKRYLQ